MFKTQQEIWLFLAVGGAVTSLKWFPDGTYIEFDRRGDLMTNRGAKVHFSFTDVQEWEAYD